MFTTLTAGIQPYLIWIKIIAVLALVAALFGAGYHVGSTYAHAEDQKALSALQAQFDAAKVQWEATKARMATDAIRAIEDRDRQNQAETATKQTRIDDLTTKYQAALKEVHDAKQAVLNRVTHPAAGTDDGLWVDVDSDTCASDPDGDSLVSQAAHGGHFAPVQQCRLSASTASRLVEEASQANEVVKNYNHALDEIKVLTTPSKSESISTSVDKQDDAGPQPEQENKQ